MTKLGWLALVTIGWMTSAERAEACSCAPQLAIVHPSTTSIAAWDGLVGRTVFVGTPTVSVSYADDPAHRPIAGTLTRLNGSDVVALWTFVPSAPLTVGRTIRAVVSGSNGFAGPLTRDFQVMDAPVGAGPHFAGVSTMTAIVSHLHGTAGGSCAPSADQQSRVGFPGLPPPSDEAPIYRYYFYAQGEQPGATTGWYGVAGHYIDTIRCGNPGLVCQPTFGGLVVGETICARVEAVDLLGRASGFTSEACATVGEEDVDLVTPGDMRIVSCVPHAGVSVPPDSGTNGSADGEVMDGGPSSAGGDAAVAVMADGGAPAADSGVAPAESDGCVCVRAGDGGLLSVLACVLALVLRRRPARAREASTQARARGVSLTAPPTPAIE